MRKLVIAFGVLCASTAACNFDLSGYITLAGDAGTAASTAKGDANVPPAPSTGDGGTDTELDAAPTQVTTPDGGSCLRHIVGPQGGSTATSVGTNSTTWYETTNALASDNIYARGDVDGTEGTDELNVGGFGFDIPAGKPIVGVEIDVQRSSDSSGIVDNFVGFKIGSQRSASRATMSGWSSANKKEAVSYGGAFDVWGIAPLTSDDVNGNGFTVLISAKAGQLGTDSTALIDYVSVRLFYCE